MNKDEVEETLNRTSERYDHISELNSKLDDSRYEKLIHPKKAAKELLSQGKFDSKMDYVKATNKKQNKLLKKYSDKDN